MRTRRSARSRISARSSGEKQTSISWRPAPALDRRGARGKIAREERPLRQARQHHPSRGARAAPPMSAWLDVPAPRSARASRRGTRPDQLRLSDARHVRAETGAPRRDRSARVGASAGCPRRPRRPGPGPIELHHDLSRESRPDDIKVDRHFVHGCHCDPLRRPRSQRSPGPRLGLRCTSGGRRCGGVGRPRGVARAGRRSRARLPPREAIGPLRCDAERSGRERCGGGTLASAQRGDRGR